MTTVLLVLAGVLAIVDWVAVVGEAPAVRWVTKPATMVALIAAAISGTDGVNGAVRWWIIAGLVLSLAGDVFLLLPEEWFVAGLAAFLLAHLAYVGGLLSVGLAASRLALGVLLVAVGAAFIGRRITASAATREPGLRVPVIAYLGVISAMAAVAIGTGEPWLIAAAVLFYCSDGLLGWDRFVAAHRWMSLAVMVTYHAAQAGFVAYLVTR